jgi:hypothetical protein
MVTGLVLPAVAGIMAPLEEIVIAVETANGRILWPPSISSIGYPRSRSSSGQGDVGRHSMMVTSAQGTEMIKLLLRGAFQTEGIEPRLAPFHPAVLGLLVNGAAHSNAADSFVRSPFATARTMALYSFNPFSIFASVALICADRRKALSAASRS